MARHLLGFAGKAHSGKDTAGLFITRQYGFLPASFAGGLKEMLRTLLTYQGEDPDIIEELLNGNLKEEQHWGFGRRLSSLGYEGGNFNISRYAMQTLGTEWGRNRLDPDFWINVEMRHQDLRNPGMDLVFTDLRFQNEVDYIQKNGGFVVKLVRPGVDSDLGVVGRHVSETQDLSCNMVLQNDGTIADLQNKLRKLITFLGWE